MIHRSGLVTRFVSMVFGELESNGNFSYRVSGVTRWLTEQRSAPAESAVADLIDRLRTFAPGRFEDDMTFVYVRRPL